MATQSFACGETVTASVRLTGDVSCQSNGGLIVGAAGIDVNLAGHGLRGPIFSGGSGPPGVLNSGGYADVTIRNGILAGWGNGIRLVGAVRNRIVDVTTGGAGAAISVEGGDANQIRASAAFGRSGGISAKGSSRLVVTGTRAHGTFRPALIIDGDLASIVRNQVTREGDGFPASGIEITGSQNRIVDNRVTGRSKPGTS